MTADEVRAVRAELTGVAAQRSDMRDQVASAGVALARLVGTDAEPAAMRLLVERVAEYESVCAEFRAVSKVLADAQLAERAS